MNDTRAEYFSLKKAVDTVGNDILQYKLEHHGIRAIVNSWFWIYLKNRRQTTQVDPHISKTEISSSVVFNDISYSSDQFNFFLFVDDTNLLYLSKKNLRALEATVNKEVANMCNWQMENKFSLNTWKSNRDMTFSAHIRNDCTSTEPVKRFDHGKKFFLMFLNSQRMSCCGQWENGVLQKSA